MAEFTPKQAAEALAGLERMERSLSVRAEGMTLMVWGLVTAGIFATYAAADAIANAWAPPLLWLPWVGAGIGVTAALWASQAMALRRPAEGGKEASRSGLLTLLFFLVAGSALFVVQGALDLDWTYGAIMLLANGVFAAALAGLLHWRYRAPALPLAVAGAVIAGIAVALGIVGPAEATANLLAAAGGGAAWVAAGVWVFVRG